MYIWCPPGVFQRLVLRGVCVSTCINIMCAFSCAHVQALCVHISHAFHICFKISMLSMSHSMGLALCWYVHSIASHASTFSNVSCVCLHMLCSHMDTFTYVICTCFTAVLPARDCMHIFSLRALTLTLYVLVCDEIAQILGELMHV